MKAARAARRIEPRPPKPSLLSRAGSATLQAAASAPASAQLALEEVVVTANKRAESVMEVPLAVQALTGEVLRELNLTSVKELASFTPGVTGLSDDSFIDSLRIRGIVTNDFGNGGDPSVGMYKNGLYQGRTGSGVFTLFDIERAEILRGPQGFLFGRNSISGAMNVITKRPEPGRTDGYVELEAGERDIFGLEGGATATINDNWAVRFAGIYAYEDGYVTNLATGNKFYGHDIMAGRVTLGYDDDRISAMVMLEYEDRDQTGTIYRATGTDGSYALLEEIYGDLGKPSDPLDINVVEPTSGIFDRGEIGSISAIIDVTTSIGTFTSLTGYKDHDYEYSESFSALSLRIFDYEQYQSGTYFEQEFRLTSNEEGPLRWYVGASFYDEDIDTDFLGRQDEDIYCNVYWGDTCQGVFDYYNASAYAYVLGDYFGTYTWTPSPTGYMEDWNRTLGRFSGWAAYVDLNYQFTEKLEGSVGVRYNYDKKEFSQEALTARNPSPVLGNRVQTGYTTPEGPLTDEQSWDDFTYRGILTFTPNDSTMMYASITTGYKQGGYNSFSLNPVGAWGTTAATPDVYEPASFDGETSISYEVGYKGDYFGGTMQWVVNAFVYEFEDMQAVCSTTTPVTVVCNVGELDGRGVESTFTAVLNDNWRINVGGAWFDSEGHDVQEFCDGADRIFGDINACEGQPIPGAPEWTAFAIVNADFPIGTGSIFGNLAWNWQDERPAGWLPLTAESMTFPESQRMLEGWSLFDLTIGYRSRSDWSAAVYVENLTDETYALGGNSGGNIDDPYVQHNWGMGRPRTFGIRTSYRF